jgi:hypothetical protein
VFCTIDFGNYKVPESLNSSTGKRQANIQNYKEFHNLVESENFLFITYLYNSMINSYLFDKRKGTMNNLTGKKGDFGFTNDFDGSMVFWPRESAGTDELIRSFNAIEFRETCDKNHVRNFKSKFPAQQNKLLDVLGKLREDSNPVIQVVTLKKG